MASGAALKRRRTIMVTERSASSDVEERSSILAQLRAWCAEHPLRPADGSPPALCDPDEIPILWDDPLCAMASRFAVNPKSDAVTDEALLAVEAAVQALGDAGTEAGPGQITRAREMLLTAVIATYPWRWRPLFGRLRQDEAVRGTAIGHLNWLSQHTDQGEMIALYIDVLGQSGKPDAARDLQILARHPWLHHQAIRGLGRLDVDMLDLEWAAAFQGGCCARRRVLRRMAPKLAERPDIRDWVLRHSMTAWPGDPFACELGRNSGGKVVDQPFRACVAAACAVAGDLAGALADPDIDDGLLDAACTIVADLFGDMGEDDIETCPDGVLIFQRLVWHLLDRCTSLTRLRRVQQIHWWLEWPPEPDEFGESDDQDESEIVAAGASGDDRPTGTSRRWRRREALGWTDDIRADLAADCERVLRRPYWPDRIRAAFATYEPYSPDNPTRGREGSTAWALARGIGVDLWEDALHHFERYPLDGYLACHVLDTDDEERIERAIRLAERCLPRAWQEHLAHLSADGRLVPRGSSLTYVVQAMARHPAYSERLMALALRSPGVRGQFRRVLEERSPALWGSEVAAALRDAVNEETNEPVRADLAAMLARLDRA